MSFSKNSSGCAEKIGQINNRFCYSQIFNLENDPYLQCKKAPFKGPTLKTFIFQTIGKDCSNNWQPYIQPNDYYDCLPKTSPKSSCSRSSNTKLSKAAEEINKFLAMQRKLAKFQQRKTQSARNNRDHFFDFEAKKFAAIDENEAIKELNDWEPLGDSIRTEEFPVELELPEDDAFNDYIARIMDEILIIVEIEVRQDFLKKQKFARECCCGCGLPVKDCCICPGKIDYTKQRFYCSECGLPDDCICSSLEDIFENFCDECGLYDCVCSDLAAITKRICSDCGFDDCICDELHEYSSGTKSFEELCICGCNVFDCICCNLQSYLARSTEKLEFSARDTIPRDFNFYSCGCTVSGCLCLRFDYDEEQSDSLCSSSCDRIDCTCRRIKTSETMTIKSESLANIICDDDSEENKNEQSLIASTKEKYDCKAFINYFIKKHQQKQIRYKLEQNPNFIINQNGNYCAICGYFNCPCTIQNASSTTIYEM